MRLPLAIQIGHNLDRAGASKYPVEFLKMPVNSSRFNRFLWVLLTCLAVQSQAVAQLPRLTDSQLSALGQQIYANECASQPACLTSWNPGEDFPSLGIGHFIWYSAGQQERFEETFPSLLHYLQQHGQPLPAWLAPALEANNPWRDRDQFLAAQQSTEMQQLRQLMSETRGLQAQFIADRFYASLPGIISGAPEEDRLHLQELVTSLANGNPPYGLYALIDYIHFKGTGTVTSERYQNQGWGLLQVLMAMPENEASLENFIQAAEQVLRQRVANAPAERNEARWLQGWVNRLQTYHPDSGTLERH